MSVDFLRHLSGRFGGKSMPPKYGARRFFEAGGEAADAAADDTGGDDTSSVEIARLMIDTIRGHCSNREWTNP